MTNDKGGWIKSSDYSINACWCLSVSNASQKVDIICKVQKCDFRACYLVRAPVATIVCRSGPWKWRELVQSRGTAASDSRGHRDRQQTRQLRKVLTLLSSIINEQQSKQIRTDGGCGTQPAVLASRSIDWAVHPQNFWGVNFMFFTLASCMEITHIERWAWGASTVLVFVGGRLRAGPHIQLCHCTLSYHRQLQPCLLNSWTGEHLTFLLSADDSCNIM